MRVQILAAIILAGLVRGAAGQGEHQEADSSVTIVRLPRVALAEPAEFPRTSPIDASPPFQVQVEDLEAAWNLAFAHDARLQALAEQRAAKEHSILAAHADGLPTLQAVGGVLISNNDRAIVTQSQNLGELLIPFQPQNQAAGGVIGNVPLYQGGRVRSLADAASFQRNSQVAATASYEQQLKLAVGLEYLDVLRLEAQLEAMRTSRDAARRAVQDANWLQQVGRMDRADALQLEARLAEAEYQVRAAEVALGQARMVYNSRLGRDPEFQAELVPLRDDYQPVDPRDLTQVALARRPELDQVLSEAQAMRAQAKSMRSARLPQVDAGGGIIYNSNPFQAPQEQAIGYLSMTWQLHDSGRSQHRSRQLNHEAAAKNHEYLHLADEIRRQVWQACAQLESARALRDAREATLEAARENQRRAERLFDQGQVATGARLDAQQELANAELALQLAEFDVVAAQLRIRYETQGL